MSTRLSALLLGLLAFGCATKRVDYRPPSDELPFSKAVLCGDTLYVAGHLGIDPDTMKPPVDAADEVRLMMAAFAATVERSGMDLDDLVQVQVFCSDLSLYSTFNSIYRSCFGQGFPARAFIGCPTLLRGCRFEIMGIAVRM